MPETVWINGKFVPRDEARVSAFDAGFQHAVGLFETMLATREGVHHAERHMLRLKESARVLGLSEDLRVGALREACEHVVSESGLCEGSGRARVRLTVTGGDLNMLSRSGESPVDPTVMIVAQAAPMYPAEMFENGVGVTVARYRANPLDPFAGHKTLNYWPRLNELRVAATKHAAEAIVLQVTNHIAGGCVSNLFAVHGGGGGGGRLITPIARGEEHADAVPSPVLPWVTRSAMLEFAEQKRLPVEKRMMSISDVLDADEVFLTNSSWGVLPVVRIEDKPIGSGRPGAMSIELRGAWEASILN